MIEDIPILDAHMHLDPAGAPEEALKRFSSWGGSHIVVVHKPYSDIRITDLRSYKKAFNRTIQMSKLTEKFGVKSWAVVGPYPGELPDLIDKMGHEEAVDLQLKAVDYSLELVEEGLVMGLGEIGRVHFPVPATVQESCDQILESALKGCKAAGCPAVLHTDSLHDFPGLMDHLARIADRSGIDRKRLIKHYSSGKMADPDINLGITVSVLANKINIREALNSVGDFLMETDYIDSLERPDIVLPPYMVPKKVSWALRSGILDKERLHRIMVDLPRETLGVEIE